MDDDRTTTPNEPPERQPRTEGEVTRGAPVQIALVLLVAFLGLLALWWLWPLLSGG